MYTISSCLLQHFKVYYFVPQCMFPHALHEFLICFRLILFFWFVVNIELWEIKELEEYLGVYLNRSGYKKISYWMKISNYLAFFPRQICTIYYSRTFFLALSYLLRTFFPGFSHVPYENFVLYLFSNEELFKYKIYNTFSSLSNSI